VAKSIFSRNHQAFQRLLKESRIAAGVSQSELADKLGRPQSFVSKIESGERLVDLIELKEICDALGISLTGFTRAFEKATR
jgi:transcriptional regulator with XRE-family HTH domain